MNICIFGGNFVRKPELKKVGEDNVSVVNFTIAVNRKYNSRSGELKKEVSFLDCEIWDTGAEAIANNCDKGDFIIIYTSAKNESWIDNDTGKKRSRVKFRVDRFEFVPGTKRHSNESSAVDETAQESPNDIPF